MAKTSKIYDEDIDLIELMFVLWQAKVIIIFFTLITLIISGLFFWLKDSSSIKPLSIYETKLILSFEYLPPDISHPTNPYGTEDNVYITFKNLFYSENNFDEWKNTNQQNSLLFENLLDYKLENGLMIRKEGKDFLTSFELEKQDKHYIRVISDEISKISEIYNYSNYVSKNLNKQYVLSLKQEYQTLISNIKEVNNSNLEKITSDFLYKSIMIDRYTKSIEAGMDIIKIKYFDEIKNINKFKKSFSYLKIIVLGFIGGLLGALLLLVQTAINNRSK